MSLLGDGGQWKAEAGAADLFTVDLMAGQNKMANNPECGHGSELRQHKQRLFDSSFGILTEQGLVCSTFINVPRSMLQQLGRVATAASLRWPLSSGRCGRAGEPLRRHWGWAPLWASNVPGTGLGLRRHFEHLGTARMHGMESLFLLRVEGAWLSYSNEILKICYSSSRFDPKLPFLQ